MKAVIFVDVQKDFVKGGSLAYAYPQKDIVNDIISFAKECRNKGYMLYATADTHEKTVYKTAYTSPLDSATLKPIADISIPTGKVPESGYMATLEGNRLPVEHCIEGTVGHEIVDGLVKDSDGNVIIPQGHIVDKPTFGSFNLLARIDQDFVVNDSGLTTKQSKFDGIGENLDEIILVGFCTSICVASNALMLRAKYPNVDISIIENLCGDINEASHNAAVQVLKNCQIDVKHYV